MKTILTLLLAALAAHAQSLPHTFSAAPQRCTVTVSADYAVSVTCAAPQAYIVFMVATTGQVPRNKWKRDEKGSPEEDARHRLLLAIAHWLLSQPGIADAHFDRLRFAQ